MFMKRNILGLSLSVFGLFFFRNGYATSGGVDSNGCHNSKTAGYHCHNSTPTPTPVITPTPTPVVTPTPTPVVTTPVVTMNCNKGKPCGSACIPQSHSCVNGIYAQSSKIGSSVYQSGYDEIRWSPRDNDVYYCVDIFSDNWTIVRQAAACGEGLSSISPSLLNLSVGAYHWKVWSPSVKDYSKYDQWYEGTFNIPSNLPKRDTNVEITWGNRNTDTFYCLDVFNDSWGIIRPAAVCGENLHSVNPYFLTLETGNYYYKVWSKSAVNYSGYQSGFEGNFTIYPNTCGFPYHSSADSIQWGCRNADTLYCIDVFSESWTPLHQPAACGEYLHSFAPKKLNLPKGKYNWKVWSPSVKDYSLYSPEFEGNFSIN